MKNLKLLVILALLTSAFAAPLTLSTKTHAEPYNLECRIQDGEFSTNTTQACDLAITKQVSVNGGAFVEADTASAAAQAHIGDTVTWKILVTNESESGLTPFGIVKVGDVLPTGVTAGSAIATTGSYSANVWTFTLSNAPATLTLTTTANTSGLIKNTATLTDYDPNNCDGPCVDPPYVDSNSANNSNDAYVNVAVVPAPVKAPVVTTPSAPNTGFGVFTTNPIRTLLAYLGAASILLILAVTARRFSKKSL